MRKAIAIDFDGCICKADWPHIGEPNMGVISAAIREQQSGAALDVPGRRTAGGGHPILQKVRFGV